jgi:hypothetical protein
MEPYCALLRAEKVIHVLDILGLIDSRTLPHPLAQAPICHDAHGRSSITASIMYGRQDRPRRPWAEIGHGIHHGRHGSATASTV